MSNPSVYLENYVENAASLPPELTRNLATVKDLDERSQDLAERIRVNIDACLTKSPHCDLGPGSAEAQEVAELRQQIEDDQRMLVQWAEEKMSLACIMADLLDMHVLQLDKDLQGLEAELDGISADLDDGYDPGASAEEARRQRQRDLEIEAEMREQKRVKREEAERRQSLSVGAPNSSLDPLSGSLAPSSQPLRATLSRGSAGSPSVFPSPAGHHIQNGRRQNLEALPTMGSEQNSKRKAAQAAVHAAAQALAQDNGLDDEGFGLDEGAGPAPYMPTLPPGMQTSAATPQAPGRLLTYGEINESLRGRRAELFWPDDNLWYLIEIHDLDLSNQKAQIMYVTGETEELDLTEIVREGHMSLVSI